MFLRSVKGNQKAALVSVWSAWLQEMIMRSTCSCPEQQTRSKQLRNKRDDNAFFECMPDSKQRVFERGAKKNWAQNTGLHIFVRIDFSKIEKPIGSGKR